MADRAVDVLLVGGGAASTACAMELRAIGFAGSVIIVGRELDPPYNRPSCSKDYLRGERDRTSVALEVPADVEVFTRTSVLGLDVAARAARLSTKEEIAFGQAVIATGANVRRLPIEGAQLDGIHHLRTLANADAIRRDVESAGTVAVVGGSYLGTELAASLVEQGKRVTVLMLEATPLELAFGPAVGTWVAALLGEKGVTVRGSVEVEAFVGPESDAARVEGVRLAGGEVVPAELVLVAAGAVPDVMTAKGSGLPIGALGGVSCDSALRVQGCEGIWAAGDMCEWDSVLHGGPARVEHWEVARAHGRTVAAGIAGDARPHDEVPYFWSDLSDWATSEYVGIGGSWDAEEVRGSFDDGAFSVFYSREGRVVGALSVGRPDDLDDARAAIRAGAGL